jgi:glutamate/tyrosine decarboxylase-like PLP-dependent enzyme
MTYLRLYLSHCTVAACGEIETRCVNMIARLFHAPLDNPEAQALGVSTIGSSEAIILSVRFGLLLIERTNV